MRDILDTLDRWREGGEEIALATVVRTVGSSPRQVGAKMAITATERMVGSVSGGCVEGAVSEEALQVLSEGSPRLIGFGVEDEEAWAVGLSCGGTIEVLVEPFSTAGMSQGDRSALEGFTDAVRAHRSVALVTALDGAGQTVRKLLVGRDGPEKGGLGSSSLEERVGERASSLLEERRSQVVTLDEEGARFFVEVYLPPPRLVMVGAVHIASVLANLARELGFRVVVSDARDRFATPDRFPQVDELLLGWPGEVLPRLELDEFSYVVVITHDSKLDNPALQAALASPAPYVGALGSSRTHARRVKALREAGVAQEDIDRIHAPIGMDIGARNPAEIALATMAEIVAVRNAALP